MSERPGGSARRSRFVATGAVGVVVVVAVVIVVLALGSDGGDDGSAALHDIIGEGQIDADQVSLEDYADVVRVVGEGDVSDDDRQAVADVLPLYLDGIGDAVVRQIETDDPDAEGGAAGDFNRPDLVAFFAELNHDDGAANAVAEGVVVWVTDLAQPLLADTDLQPSEVGTTFDPVAPIIGAIADGFDATDGGALSGNEVEGIVIEQLREDLALAVAADRGLPTPEPGDYGETLAEAFPDVDFLGDLDVDASNQRRDDLDAPW